jgi:hypothetical protein
VVDGRVCPAEIPGSAGAADDTFHVRAAWLNGRRLSWWVEGTTEGLPAPVAGNLVLGTTLHRDCSAPSPTAAYAPLPNRPVALDGASRYHTDGRTLVRRDVSAGPSLAPPDNADVAHAQLITRTPPIFIGAHIGYAIRAASDPPVRGRRAGYAPTAATRTLWFDFRPPEAQRLLISGGGGPFGGDLTYGALAVYDDAGDGVLTELPARPGSDPPAVEVRADPSHRYLIAVGCDDAGPCWPASWIQISPAASAGPVAAPRR